MDKVKLFDGRDYIIRLYSNNNFIGFRKVYYRCGKYFVKFKGRYGEILDFNVDGICLASFDVEELYFR